MYLLVYIRYQDYEWSEIPFPVVIGVYSTKDIAELNKKEQISLYITDSSYKYRLERHELGYTQHPRNDIVLVSVDTNQIFDLYNKLQLEMDKDTFF